LRLTGSWRARNTCARALSISNAFHLRCGVRPEYNPINHDNNIEEEPTMTRTPTTIVTATRIAARAFAWGFSIDAHDFGIAVLHMPLSSPLTPQ